ncbi:MAG TPA: hypothetical protein VF933_15370 [Streptosporangiaceae bacterium]
MQDLADQLVAAASGAADAGRSLLALHLEVMHRLAKAALVGKLDPVVASAAAEALLGSVFSRMRPTPDGDDAGETLRQVAAAVMGQTSRCLAWLGARP